MLQVNETGVTFRSYRDGQHVTLTPESTVRHQVCPSPPEASLCPLPCMHEYVRREAFERPGLIGAKY